MEGKTCPVCGHKHTDHLTRQKNYEWHICPECDFAFIDQNLPPDETFDVESAERGESYIEFYGKKQRAKMRRAEKRARSLAGLMTGKLVLDVGCNLGYFVEACRTGP